MVQHPEPKKAVALIRNLFTAHGQRVKTKDAYELLAQLWGYKDWATYRGMHPTDSDEVAAALATTTVSYARTETILQGWPTWVIMEDTDENGVPELRLLPPGATLDNRCGDRYSSRPIEDEDAELFTVGFNAPEEPRESWEDLVVVTKVTSQYPRSDRYGFPMYANEREVVQWIEEELGWGYLANEQGDCLVEVDGNDSGDDTLGLWWAEIRVHPDVHARLLTQFAD